MDAPQEIVRQLQRCRSLERVHTHTGWMECADYRRGDSILARRITALKNDYQRMTRIRIENTLKLGQATQQIIDLLLEIIPFGKIFWSRGVLVAELEMVAC